MGPVPMIRIDSPTDKLRGGHTVEGAGHRLGDGRFVERQARRHAEQVAAPHGPAGYGHILGETAGIEIAEGLGGLLEDQAQIGQASLAVGARAAGDDRVQAHAVADAAIGDIFPDGGDGGGDLVAEDVRRLDGLVAVAKDPLVGAADGAGVDLQEDIVVADRGRGDGFDSHIAGGVEDSGFHQKFLTRKMDHRFSGLYQSDCQ